MELRLIGRDERRVDSIGRVMLRCAVLLWAVLALPAHGAPVRGENVESELIAATDAVAPGQPLQVALRLKHDPHWHTYWQVPGDSGLPTQIRWTLPAGWSASALQWPVPKRLPVGPLMNYGYEGEVLLLAELSPPAELKPGGAAYFEARADWLICKDVCIPGGADLRLIVPVAASAAPSRWAPAFVAARALVPQVKALDAQRASFDGKRVSMAFRPAGAIKALEFFPLQEGRIDAPARQALSRDADTVVLTLAAAATAAADTGWTRLRGVVVANGGPRDAARGGWAVEVDMPLDRSAALAASTATRAAGGWSFSDSLWLALAGAFIGGLILNLMPCVFPVLSLKLLSLMAHQREPGRHAPLTAHGFAYAIGVVASFVLLAAAVLGLRAAGAEIGWGFQLQSPWIVAALIGLFFLIGLNLLGTFELTFGGGLASSDAARGLQSDRLSGSFATGVLAVVVAAPCTAPFMGAAMGYAFVSTATEALAVFVALGIGMAAPYVLLTAMPELLARLPRPGAWMERFKQAMAFPMFATCVWLLWVLVQQVGGDATALLLAALVLVGMAAWAFGLAQRGTVRFRWLFGAAAVAAGFTLLGAASVVRTPGVADAGRAGWTPWSVAEQQRALAAGSPVFVDFTAAWCVTCQFNKRTVLISSAVERMFAERRVVRLHADWTNRDDAITRELARFGRNGVPLYVLYDTRGNATVLPELLTERMVLEALRKL